MEDAIDIRDRLQRHNIIKWYNVNYQPAIPDKSMQKEEVDPMDVLARINQDKIDVVQMAIQDAQGER